EGVISPAPIVPVIVPVAVPVFAGKLVHAEPRIRKVRIMERLIVEVSMAEIAHVAEIMRELRAATFRVDTVCVRGEILLHEARAAGSVEVAGAVEVAAARRVVAEVVVEAIDVRRVEIRPAHIQRAGVEVRARDPRDAGSAAEIVAHARAAEAVHASAAAAITVHSAAAITPATASAACTTPSATASVDGRIGCQHGNQERQHITYEVPWHDEPPFNRSGLV